jgi:multiple sugar transport system permease protein
VVLKLSRIRLCMSRYLSPRPEFVLEYGVGWGPMTAGGVVVSMPTLAFSFVAERYLVRGLSMGGLKE